MKLPSSEIKYNFQLKSSKMAIQGAGSYVFTALFGKYETLNELKIQPSNDVRYLCFTDDQSLQSSTWEICQIDSSEFLSSVRASRHIKMLGHRYLPLEARSLYIDNSIELKVCGSKILDVWLADSDLAMMEHSSRKTVLNEFLACSIYSLERQDKLLEQFRYYKDKYPEILFQKPFWGGMIARKFTVDVDLFMEVWAEQYERFARRDQLSINVTQQITQSEVKAIKGENSSTEWHTWPHSSGRNNLSRDGIKYRKVRKIIYVLNLLKYGFPYLLHYRERLRRGMFRSS